MHLFKFNLFVIVCVVYLNPLSFFIWGSGAVKCPASVLCGLVLCWRVLLSHLDVVLCPWLRFCITVILQSCSHAFPHSNSNYSCQNIRYLPCCNRLKIVLHILAACQNIHGTRLALSLNPQSSKLKGMSARREIKRCSWLATICWQQLLCTLPPAVRFPSLCQS